VNTRARKSFSGGDGYAIKVGDLCYVAIGQIVNRRLFVSANWTADSTNTEDTRWRHDERPAVWILLHRFARGDARACAAVRSDWAASTPPRTPPHCAPISRRTATGPDSASLLFYYPAVGRREVHERIRKLVDEPGESNLWPVGRLMDMLHSFDWPN